MDVPRAEANVVDIGATKETSEFILRPGAPLIIAFRPDVNPGDLVRINPHVFGRGGGQIATVVANDFTHVIARLADGTEVRKVYVREFQTYESDGGGCWRCRRRHFTSVFVANFRHLTNEEKKRDRSRNK